MLVTPYPGQYSLCFFGDLTVLLHYVQKYIVFHIYLSTICVKCVYDAEEEKHHFYRWLAGFLCLLGHKSANNN